MIKHHRRRDLPQYYRCNRLIHQAIVDAADNAVLASLYESVTTRIRRARFVAPMAPSHWELAVHEHEAILNALQRRDGAGLSHILRRHLRHKREAVERAGFAESTPPTEQQVEPARQAASG
jgi:DNA-binding GntR family transcriptional regulator